MSTGARRPPRDTQVAPDALDVEELAGALGELARQLADEDDPGAVLTDIARAAVRMIPGADAASITTITGRTVLSRAATGDLPRQVDALQEETGQGPCLDAIADQQTVRVPDLATEDRWPDFAARAAELGAGSMLSFQLFVAEDNVGALNLYSRSPHAFGEESDHVGLLVAAHAAIAYVGARRQEDLERALDARDLIGQAKGILMERFGLTGQRAFQVLVRLSNESNRKLRDLALDVVRSPRGAGSAGPGPAGPGSAGRPTAPSYRPVLPPLISEA
jgi:GAF domain-containing protein